MTQPLLEAFVPQATMEPEPDTSEASRAPWMGYKSLLTRAKLKPTRQRLLMSWLLFSQGNRHVTAEMVYAEATDANLQISLATVYNTLNQFTEAGLLRQIGVEGGRSFFDTNPTNHSHFFIPGESELRDIPGTNEWLAKLPPPPEGYEVASVDVVVRLRPRQPSVT